MAEDLLARILGEIRDRKRVAAAAHEEYARLEDAGAASGRPDIRPTLNAALAAAGGGPAPAGGAGRAT